MRIQQVLNKQRKPPLHPLLRKEGKWGGQIFINLPLLIENLLNINKNCSNIRAKLYLNWPLSAVKVNFTFIGTTLHTTLITQITI
jgi:hypothetical protein